MAILAARRRWLVTSLCAALRSPCSRQRFASRHSSSACSMGKRRISARYRVVLPETRVAPCILGSIPRDRAASFHSSAILRRSDPGHMTKRRREGTCFTESELERDFGHRASRLRQQCLGAFDAATDVIAVRRNAERLFEGEAEIVGAQMNELRQRFERYRLGEVFLDV